MTIASCTYVGATSGRFSCTTVGATLHVDLAPFFVQHRSGELAPPPVQHTLHPRWFNNEYLHLLIHSRHALACKTALNLYRILRRLTLTYRTTEVTTDRTRGEEAS